jgi:hypothetical protein
MAWWKSGILPTNCFGGSGTKNEIIRILNFEPLGKAVWVTIMHGFKKSGEFLNKKFFIVSMFRAGHQYLMF